MRAAFLVLAAALSIGGCARPDPPKITPRSAAVTTITPAALGLNVKLDVENPNAVDLSAHALTAKVTLDGKQELGSVTTRRPIDLPAHKTTSIDVPVLVKWQDLSSVAGLVAQSRDIPYLVEGTVELGNDTFNIDVPFRLTGTLTHQQLVQATLSSLPKIPGLTP